MNSLYTFKGMWITSWPFFPFTLVKNSKTGANLNI